MSDSIARAVIDAEVNADGVDVGIAKITKSLDTLGAHAVKTGQAASTGLEKSGDGAAVAASKVDASTKNMIAAIQRQIAVTEAGSKSSADYYKTLASQRGVDTNALAPYLAQLDAVTQKQRMAAASAAAVDPAVQKLGMSAKQAAFAMRGLPAQMTDIVVSLQSGQRPMTVFMQQGGQLKDMFGGIVPAAKAMATYIMGLVNPLTIGAAALAGIAYAAYKGSEQMQDLNKVLIASGNMAGMSGNQLAMLADKVGAATGKYGEAREAAAALVATGMVSASQMETALKGVVNGATVTGKSVKDMVEIFDQLAKDPLDTLKKLNQQYNFLTPAVYENVQALVEQGKKQEAATIAFKAFAEANDNRAPQIIQNLGTIEGAWKSISAAIGAATTELMKFGRKETLADERKRVAENLANMEQSGNASLAGLIADSKQRLSEIDEQIREEGSSIKKAAETAAKNQRDIEAIDFRKKYLDTSKHQTLGTALEKENEDFERAVIGLQKGTAEYEKVYAGHLRNVQKIRDQYKDKKAESEMDKETRAWEKLIQQINEHNAASELEMKTGIHATDAQKLRIKLIEQEKNNKYELTQAEKDAAEAAIKRYEVNERLAKQSRFDQQYAIDSAAAKRELIGSYQLELNLMGKTAQEAEKLTFANRELFATEDAIRKGRDSVSADTADRMRRDAQERIAIANQYIDQKYARERDPWAGLTDSITRYGEEAAKVGKQIGDAFTNSMNAAEDAWVKYVQTGKLSIKSLMNTVVAETARAQFRQMVGNASSGNGILGLMGSLFGAMAGASGSSSGSTVNTGIGSSWSGTVKLGGYADGGDPPVGVPSIVGERGPEIFVPKTSGTIIPNHALGGSSITFAPVYQIDARADRAAVRSDMERISAKNNAQLIDKLSRKGLIAA